MIVFRLHFLFSYKYKMCEATLIIGSSLGKQLSNACKMNHIDSLLFQGKIPLNFVKTELDKRNKSYRVIYVLCGNIFSMFSSSASLFFSSLHTIEKELSRHIIYTPVFPSPPFCSILFISNLQRAPHSYTTHHYYLSISFSNLSLLQN